MLLAALLLTGCAHDAAATGTVPAVNATTAPALPTVADELPAMDAAGFRQLLQQLRGTPVVVNPDARLSQVAGQRRWKIERWRMAPGNWRLPMPDPRSPEYREAVRR